MLAEHQYLQIYFVHLEINAKNLPVALFMLNLIINLKNE